MTYNEDEIIANVNKIRKEIGHEEAEIQIRDLFFNEKNEELWIIASDRPDKSAIIGKGGWVVGRLKEDLQINKIHVESYTDYILKKYQLELSLNRINNIIAISKKTNEQLCFPLNNLKKLLESKINEIYKFNLEKYLDYLKNKNNKNNKINQDYKNSIDKSKHSAIVALSGGVDSSFSLIIAKYLGFNPIAITIDPGTIIVPNQFKDNVNSLCEKLAIKHEYLKVDYSEIIENSLNGKYHPCGRCSNLLEEKLYEFAKEKNISMVIFGDMISTGTQSITIHEIASKNSEKSNINTEFSEKENNNDSNIKIYRLNLPASLAIGKEEIKKITEKFNVKSISGFGCPLLFEVHKKYPYMKKFSIQRILRETRVGALEPGQALDLIWSFNK